MFGKNNDNLNSSKLKLMRSIIQINEMASFSDFQEIEFSTKRSYLHIRYNNVFLHYFYTDSINPPTEYEGDFDKNTFLEQVQQLKCYIEEMFQQSRLKKSKLANAVDEALLDFNIFFAIFIGMAIAIAWMFCFSFSTLLSALYN